MSSFNKSYRIRTKVGEDTHLHVKLDSDYDVLKIMSLEIKQENAYKMHTSNYGVIAGRVLANEAFGIPNAKVSVFINIDNVDINDVVKSVLYPYNTTESKNKDGVRYNLFADEQLTDCHSKIGTFPEKQYLLDNNDILEVFEKYYKYTTRTNNSGDYMIFGVPVGSQTIHVDIDLSDIGILSQKPRDMVYKGYNIEQFENPNKFKYDTNLDSLVQVVSQNTITDVIPFWGDDTNTKIGITRCDVNIEYKFEPTCVFMGSVVSDTSSNGISKKCIPTPGMGSMEELTTGSGTIEMIRKTPSGDVEEFQIKGNQLINGDGVWCYQIPMNLDYMMTDEYGNTVPTDDPKKGIPTRTSVRFRISLQDFDNDNSNIFRCKMLVPHNPDVYSNNCMEQVDYQFGTKTQDGSFKDLFWNGVYSVKSYIPRVQKGSNWKNEKFTGFKRINYHGDKNPLPYNNIRIKIPLMYTLLCLIFKMMITLVGFLNRLFKIVARSFVNEKNEGDEKTSGSFLTLSGEMCDDNLDYLCVIPGVDIKKIAEKNNKRTTMLGMTFLRHYFEFTGQNGKLGDGGLSISSFDTDEKLMKDEKSIDIKNSDESNVDNIGKSNYENPSNKNEKHVSVKLYGIRVTDSVDYLVQCIEMNLAQEYKVIQFDFYNDWINGVIYIPRWMRNISKKRTFLWGAIKVGGKVKACNENYGKKRNLVQQCGITYNLNNNNFIIDDSMGVGCTGKKGKLRCHKSKNVRKTHSIFGSEKGIVKTVQTIHNQYVYYFKPCELGSKNARLFATDIILLGTLNDCDKWGIPNNLTELYSSTYQMPPNLALTDSDIEGSSYETENNSGAYISFKLNNKKETIKDIDMGGCYSGIGIRDEDGNYTEVSGIDWGYTGPLQGSEKDINDFYKPGGHFLGLTCRNSETTIKSCVNLSRICEHGVWMSQRKELNIANSKSTDFLEYATVPSGLISKDEISDTDYRRLFASMNKNHLKTVINNETGYPIYDFEYVNPINFNGELSDKVSEEKLMNKMVSSTVVEKTYNYTDDDYYNREATNDKKLVKEVQIIRTGEFKDDEYFKFRFGLNDSNINSNTEKSKRFLIYSSDNKGSMPIYDNSFYFYFGLHDGKTALDEFKKTYYSNCEKMKSLTQIDNSISIINIETTYDGVKHGSEYKSFGSGTLSFEIKTNDDILGKNLIIHLKNENGDIIGTKTNITKNNRFYFDGLHGGNYTINITSNDDLTINETFDVTINMIKINSNLNAVNFIKNVLDKNENDVFKYDRKKYKGYITINNNEFVYENNDVTSNINIFDDYVKNIIVTSGDNNVIANLDINNRLLFTLNGSNEVNVIQENNSINYMIPVHKCDIEYTVYIETYMDSYGKITNNFFNSSGTHIWEIGKVIVNNAEEFDVIYNDISYNHILKTIIDSNNGDIDSYNGWWAISENGGLSLNGDSNEFEWKLKHALYLDSLYKPHNILINPLGGTLPHNEEIICMRESKSNDPSFDNYLHDIATYGSENKTSILNGITIPTINFLSGRTDDVSVVKRRCNFKYKAYDVNEQSAPEDDYFIFPVIYKPFFMEMGLWYINNNDKFYLHGNVYNGITWDYENEGFNNITLNDVKLLNVVNKLQNDDSYMEFNEPTLKNTYGINNNGGYSFTGVTNNNKILPLFKYNGRKTVIQTQVEPTMYGFGIGKITENVNITIGCNHVHDELVYSNNAICETDSNSGITFSKYYLNSYLEGRDFFIKFNVETPAGINTDYFMLDCDDYNAPSVSNSNKLIIDDKIFRHIMDGTVKNANLSSHMNDSGYIKINNELNNKKIFYISVVNGGGSYNVNKGNITSSNENNKIKSISVSDVIDLGFYCKFYPMEISIRIFDGLNLEVKDFETKMFITGKTETFKNKTFEFKFYHKSIFSKRELLKTIKVDTESNLDVVVDLTKYRDDLNKEFALDRLEIDYDVYEGEYKAPTTFSYKNEDGSTIVKIESY